MSCCANSADGSCRRPERKSSLIEPPRLPIAAQRLHRAMDDRAHVRFAQFVVWRSRGSSARRRTSARAIRGRDRAAVDQRAPAVRHPSVRRVVFRVPRRPPAASSSGACGGARAVVDRDVARDRDSQVANPARSRRYRWRARQAFSNVSDVRSSASAVSRPVAEEVVDARQLLRVHRVPVRLGRRSACS